MDREAERRVQLKDQGVLAILAPKRYGGPLGLGPERTLIFARPVSWLLFAAHAAIAVFVAASRR